MIKRLLNAIGIISMAIAIAGVYLFCRTGSRQVALIRGHTGGSLVVVELGHFDLGVEVYTPWPCEQPWERKSFGLGEGFVGNSPTSLSRWEFVGVRETSFVEQLELDESGKPRWGDGIGSHLSLWTQPLSPPITVTSVQINYVAITIFFGMISAGWILAPRIARYRHQERKRNFRCMRCGYDLRATPGRCPECGLENIPGK